MLESIPPGNAPDARSSQCARPTRPDGMRTPVTLTAGAFPSSVCFLPITEIHEEAAAE